MLTRAKTKSAALLGAFTLGILAIASAPSAAAETAGSGRCNGGTCVVKATTPSAPGGAGSSAQPVAGNAGAPKEANFCEINQNLGSSVPYRCDVNYDPSRQCTWTTMKPQPAPPAGADPTRGAWEECLKPANALTPAQNEIRWMENTAAGTTSPAQAAVEVVKEMQLKGIKIGMVPYSKDQQGMGAVGLPAWMWVDDTTDAQAWGPYTVSKTVDGVTVQATARPLQVTWDMGNGESVVCTSAGTPYEDRFGKQKSPDCGYVYQKMGDYRVSAITTWSVEWAAGGQNGVIETVTRSAQDVQIGEFQALNVRP